MKDKFTIGLTTNNHGENYQDAFWRGGTYFNIDSPLGIGDNFYFSYTSVHKKNPDRSWKDVPDVPSPGEILPIGPKGYDPSKGDTFILGGTGVNDNSTILQRTNKFILASFVSINYDNLEKWTEKKDMIQ